MTKIHYTRNPENSTKSCKARGSDLRVHFKNTHEAAMALRSMPLKRAQVRNIFQISSKIKFTKYFLLEIFGDLCLILF